MDGTGNARAVWRIVAVDQAIRTPQSVESILHLVHGVPRTVIIGASTTNEVVAVLRMRTTAGIGDHNEVRVSSRVAGNRVRADMSLGKFSG